MMQYNVVLNGRNASVTKTWQSGMTYDHKLSIKLILMRLMRIGGLVVRDAADSLHSLQRLLGELLHHEEFQKHLMREAWQVGNGLEPRQNTLSCATKETKEDSARPRSMLRPHPARPCLAGPCEWQTYALHVAMTPFKGFRLT